ncbi:MAG: phage tail length tape measure family protein [Rhizobiales bacterium]|nr:phage tail length tape measure family protein [Hyphomicrobiales bacterium]
MQTNVIRQVTIKAQASGVASAAAELNRLSAAQDGVTVASDRAERRTLSVERAYERLQRQLDAGYRATKQFEAAQRDLDRAMDQGLIDQQRYGQLIDLAAERQARAAAASHAMATAQVSSANGVKLNAGQVQNLSFQLNDMAVMLASGQNPFVMMMQQGMQMAQVFGPGVGVGAALKATGSALVGFLTNPLTLAVVGIAAAAGAVSLLFEAVSGGGRSAEEVLKQQKELIDAIKDAYDDAKSAAERLAQKQGQMWFTDAARERLALTKEIGAATDLLARQMNITVSNSSGLGAIIRACLTM